MTARVRRCLGGVGAKRVRVLKMTCLLVEEFELENLVKELFFLFCADFHGI